MSTESSPTLPASGPAPSIRIRFAMRPPLLQARGVSVDFQLSDGSLFGPERTLHAVRDVSLSLQAGQCLGIVGESGSGKSTLARALCGLQPIVAGTIRYAGQPLAELGRERWRHMQMVYQDPLSSLNPRMAIGDIVAEPIRNLRPDVSAGDRPLRVRALLEQVGLDAVHVHRYPHELSGGQRQRVAIARALAAQPDLLICDEPLSALDVSIQAQIMNLLADLKRSLGVSILLISHDLAAVRHLSEQVMVMYRGQVLERGGREQIYESPAHPYTRNLLAAVMERMARKLVAESARGEVTGSGCVYASRCPKAQARCQTEAPVLAPWEGRDVACHFPG